MVAVLVRLKLVLLRNTLMRSPMRAVALVLGVLFGAGFVALGVSGLVAARSLSIEQASAVVVLGGSALIAGWIVFPVLLSGVDETLDTSRFALLPLSARQLLPGLLAAGAVGVPGVATIVLAMATLATWSRGPGAVAVAAVAAILGIVTCLLAARVVTSALAGLMASRRFKDVAGLMMTLLFMTFAVGINTLGGVVGGSLEATGRRLVAVSVMLGWTPLGWAWSAPAESAGGEHLIAIAKLGLATALVAALAFAWHHFVAIRLTSVITVGSSSVRSGSRLARLLPDSPVGATALRCLRYWRRDPRYISSLTGILLAPLAITAVNVVGADAASWLVWVPVMIAFLIGVSTSQDLSYDGSSLWTQISTGVSGRDDLAGRAMAMFFWSLPLLSGVIVGAAVITDRWDTLPQVIGLSFALALGGVGVGLAFSAHFQGPAPPPGANPFSSGSGSSFQSVIAVLGAMAISGVLSVPMLALVIGAIWVPALNWVALVVGPLWGAGVLVIGLRVGGAHLDEKWPEILSRVIAHAD